MFVLLQVSAPRYDLRNYLCHSCTSRECITIVFSSKGNTLTIAMTERRQSGASSCGTSSWRWWIQCRRPTMTAWWLDRSRAESDTDGGSLSER